MNPAGYQLKRVMERPAWLGAPVADIYSVSDCISKAFSDVIDYWKHNGHGFFDNPEILKSLAAAEMLELSGTSLFYYEVFEFEFDADIAKWGDFYPDESFATDVRGPIVKQLQGFDVVSFSSRIAPECSPLSCNALAETISVNQHGLFDTFEEAHAALEHGFFKHAEPGPYRIFAVYLTDWPWRDL
jgi:hypothetical protein